MRIFVVTSTNIVVYPNITIHGFYITLSHSQFSLFNFQGAFLPTVPAKMGSSGSLSEGMVGTSGFEPPTSRLSGVRSNHLSYAPMFLGLFTCYPHNPFPGSCGGDEEDRTPDPLRARQMLSQLSYTPKSLLRESLSEPSKLNNILLRPSTPRIQESTLLSPAAFSP